MKEIEWKKIGNEEQIGLKCVSVIVGLMPAVVVAGAAGIALLFLLLRLRLLLPPPLPLRHRRRQPLCACGRRE